MDMNRITKCKNCGKEFELSLVQYRRYLANPSKNNFCSKSCSAIYRHKEKIVFNKNKERDATGKFVKKEYTITTGICKNCGKQFELTKYQKKRLDKDKTLNVFCTKSCSAKYSNAHRNDDWKETTKRNNMLIHGEEHYVNKEAISKSIKKLYETREDYGFKSKQYKENLKAKYGVDNIGKSEWIKQHNLEKYGTEFYFQSDDYKQKTLKTNRSKYGTDWHMQNKEQVAKYRQTIKEKYGVEWITDVPEVSDKIKQSLKSKYTGKFMENRFVSKVNQKFIDTLNSLNIDSGKEFYIYPYFFDIKVGNTLIEINPTISHNVTYNVFGGHITNDYHLKKTKVANEAGYNCIHIFDWDDTEKIIDNLLPRQALYARNLEVRYVSEDVLVEFLSEYHFQGSCKNQNIRLGLYQNEELIQVMTFGKPRYNKKYEWELLRLCTKSKYKVIGGAEKLFKFFLNNYEVSNIISYCDLSKFTGDVYSKLGFKLQATSKPTVHWYNMTTNRHITDNLLRQLGFSKLHGDVNYKLYNKGDDNKELMLKNGYVEVYDCGQATYVYIKE